MRAIRGRSLWVVSDFGVRILPLTSASISCLSGYDWAGKTDRIEEVLVTEIEFPDWAAWLQRAGLPDRQRQSGANTLRWYLSFCRRGRGGVNYQTARDFLTWAQQTKNPEPGQLES